MDRSKLTLENAFKSYSGKPGCMCGCLGTYKVASAHREFAEDELGYKYDDNAVNDAAVKRAFNKIMNDPNVDIDFYGNTANACVDTATRRNAIFFRLS